MPAAPRADLSADDRFETDLEVCSEVMLYLSTLMAKLQPGQVLAFTASDPEAERAIVDWAALRGYALLAVEALGDGRTRFFLRR